MLFHEKIAYAYFQQLFTKKATLGDAFHRLNEYEQREIARIKRRAFFYAGLFGALGVVLLYLPLHLCPKLFPNTALVLPYAGKVSFSWAYLLYMVFLALLEIYALTWLNLLTVYAMCRVCRFPHIEDKDFEAQVRILFEVSLDKSNTLQRGLGINPMAGLSPLRVFAVSTLFILKATLSNMLLRFLLKRIGARVSVVGYAYFVDYMSVFVFAAWNIYATHIMVSEAKTRIMAPNLIHQLVKRLHYQFKDNTLFKDILLEILQFIAIAKRNYHHNHYLLAHNIINTFDLPRLPEIKTEQAALLEKIKTLPEEVKQGIAKLFVLGLLVDGHVSWREQSFVRKLAEMEIWQLSPEKLLAWNRDFTAGKGLDELFQAGVPLSAAAGKL